MTAPVTEVRPAAPADREAVQRVLVDAFGEDEGTRVVRVLDDLRSGDLLVVGLVAEVQGAVVGYVGLSRAWVDAREQLVDVLVLSPLAVAADHQRRGVGARLLDAALAAAEAELAPLVLLEGDPGYYGRLGWTCAEDEGIGRPSTRIPRPAFQCRVLPGREDWMRGAMVYPSPWWLRDLVGLRDPLLAELEKRLG